MTVITCIIHENTFWWPTCCKIRYKNSTTIKEAFNLDYRKIDIEYDTTKNNRFKKVNLLLDINAYLDKSKKNLYLDLLNSNDNFILNNKVSNEIIENNKYFKNLVNSL